MPRPLEECLEDELTDRAAVFALGRGEVLEIKGGRITLMLVFNPAQNREGFFYGLQQIFNAPNFDAAAFTALNHKYDSYPVTPKETSAKTTDFSGARSIAPRETT